jgi:VanZ like family
MDLGPLPSHFRAAEGQAEATACAAPGPGSTSMEWMLIGWSHVEQCRSTWLISPQVWFRYSTGGPASPASQRSPQPAITSNRSHSCAPFSVRTVSLALVLVPLAGMVVRRLGGSGSAAGGAALALIGVADVTVLRPGLLHAHADWSRVATACVITDPGSLSAESVLNIALFVPFAFLAVVALGRALPAAIVVVAVVVTAGALSLGIEATQAAYGIGACDSSDVLHNVVGAGLGAAAGLMVLGVVTAVRVVSREPRAENGRTVVR